MHDTIIFTAVAQQHGFDAQVAHAALTATAKMLYQRGHTPQDYFYLYRTGKRNPPSGEGSSARPRVVLAFYTPDTALAFAQHNRLTPTPRLLRLSLARLLATLMQRPTIGAVLFADEPIEMVAGYLPVGLRLERAALLNMLTGG